MRKVFIGAAMALSTAMIAAPVSAQQNSGLVAVQIGDVEILRNSLNNNQVEVLNNFLNNNNLLNDNQLAVPVTVNVPVGIAANVCGTTVAVLSAAGSTGTCTATQSSRALNQAIIRQVINK